MIKEKKFTLKLPEELHTEFKMLAAQKKTTMKELLIKFIQDAIKKESKK